MKLYFYVAGKIHTYTYTCTYIKESKKSAATVVAFFYTKEL